jgi:hypothetical protein
MSIDAVYTVAIQLDIDGKVAWRERYRTFGRGVTTLLKCTASKRETIEITIFAATDIVTSGRKRKHEAIPHLATCSSTSVHTTDKNY